MSFIAIKASIYYHDVFGPFDTIKEAEKFVEKHVADNFEDYADGDGFHWFEIHEMEDGRMARHCRTYIGTKMRDKEGDLMPPGYSWLEPSA